MYFYIKVPLSAFASSQLNGSLESPPLLRGVPLDVYQISSLSGFLLRAFNFRGRNVITFYSFQTGETQSEDKGEEHVRVREARGYDRTKGRRSRNELRGLKRGGGDEEYPRARQHDYEPQLCLRRLPATQRSSGTVDHESSFDNLWKRYFFFFIYQRRKRLYLNTSNISYCDKKISTLHENPPYIFRECTKEKNISYIQKNEFFNVIFNKSYLNCLMNLFRYKRFE